MKLPDSYQLQPEEYYLITDQWKQEWEKGVQVPVNLDEYPDPVTRIVPLRWESGDFKLPKKHLKCEGGDSEQSVSALHKLAAQACRYDLDDTDTQWLKLVNKVRDEVGDEPIGELLMEKLMEECETQCHDNMTHAILTQEGLGIEYDEDVICDVCRSPDCEEGNEMVFCDSCDICVHQACYGIVKIPEGSWMCRTCALGMQPVCLLCPKKGGAMKSTRSGAKWAHVSCALWIPEVSIGCVEKMEPITKISQIPGSRWALICSLCRERTGACIQCSVKTCKTAYHVTCGFQNNLEMKTYLDESSDVKFKSYCMSHTKKRQQGDIDVMDSPMKSTPKKEKTQEEKANERALGIQQLEDEFFKQVRAKDVASALDMKDNLDAVDMVCEYWKLKRKSNFNRPLVTPKKEESGAMSQAEEDSLIARMRMFVHLRQDLERVRNLCYMVQKREKLSRQSNKLREQIFHRQSELLDNDSGVYENNELEWIRTAVQCSEREIMTIVRTESDALESTSESTSQEEGSDSQSSAGSHSSTASRKSKRHRRRKSYSQSSEGEDSKQSLVISKPGAYDRSSADSTAETEDRTETKHINNNMLSNEKEDEKILVKHEDVAIPEEDTVGQEDKSIVAPEETALMKDGKVPGSPEWSQKENKDDKHPTVNLKRLHETENSGSKSKKMKVNGSYDKLAQRRIDSFLTIGNPMVVLKAEKGKNIPDAETSKKNDKNRRCTSRTKSRTSSNASQTRFNMIRRTEISPRQETMRDEAAKVRESLFASQSCPRGSLSGYRIPKKNNPSSSSVTKNRLVGHVKDCLDNKEQHSDLYTLKTRSARRKLDTELEVESNSVDKQYEYVDDEVSICRSSRDTSPIAELDDAASRSSSVKSGPTRRSARIKRTESSDDDCNGHSDSDSNSIDVENASSHEYDSDSEGSSSGHSGPMTRRKRSRSEGSVTSKYPFRSRMNDTVSRVWSTAAGF
ncbi:protein Jade-3-like [Ptychodera flava]|uniref:protein Jade-3-like n=1 Tax=Ptychodera flava TaxID=63121 RepID=UPI00396AA623